ncbi:S8 family serine peptidase, partial [Chloroflexota bacterium]
MIKRLFVIMVLLTLLAQLFPGSLFQATRVEAQEPDSSSRISNLLALQIQAKLRAVNASRLATASEASEQAEQFDILQSPGIRLEDLNKQQIFIHFTEEPTQSQIEELEADNISLHLDSWMPPVGGHTNGFMLADMPIEKLEALAGKGYIVRLETAERVLKPHNDLATQKINVDDVWSSGYNGTGVRIAVLDSGLDVNHADIPTPVAKKDYSNYPTLDDTIANIYGLTGHGTHVTGSVLGRGTQSAGVYKGSALGADLIFLKIGNDTTSGASVDAMVYAIRDAVDVYNADIITMSYGGWDTYHDGTSEESQAVDYAVSQGATVFVSAGNSANYDAHYSGTVAASSTTDFIQINVTGSSGTDTTLWFNMVWYDGTSTSNVLSSQFYDTDQVTTIPTVNEAPTESSRGTEARMSYIGPSQGSLYAAPNGTYYVKVTNSSEASQDFHLYVWFAGAGSVTFEIADPNYTIGSPADADGAIAVGAYTTRTTWYDYANNLVTTSGQTVDQISTFSSRGPRVDTGAPSKPNIVAPGCFIISTSDNVAYPWVNRHSSYIDNDGPNRSNAAGGSNDGNGPADYYVMQGTSMACPIAAGVAALILQKNPSWTPTQVKQVLESTATDKGAAGHDNDYGWGLVDALAAVGIALPSVTTNAADNISANSATLNGSLDSLGDYATANVSFVWGTTQGGPYPNTTTPQVMGSTGNFTATLSDLSDNTTYYFKAKATNGVTIYGTELSFTTVKLPPTVITNAASDITTNSATLNANLTSLGDYTPVFVTFVWGQTPSGPYPNTNPTPPPPMTSNGTFTTPLSGLTIDTTYYFKAKAMAGGISVYGDEVSFTTVSLVSIDITPDNPGIPLGQTRQFTATGTYSDESTGDITNIVDWTSGNTSVADIGLHTGLATTMGKADGQTIISATFGEISDNTSLTVLPPELESIAVTPANVFVHLGRTHPFTAIGTYSDGSTVNITTPATWTSSNPAKATIADTGLATTIAVGYTIITASKDGITSNEANLIILGPVLNSITVIPTPPPASVAAGQLKQFSAIGNFSNNATANITNLVTWTSSDGSKAVVGLYTGLARGRTEGNTVITATRNEVSGNTTLNVTGVALKYLVIIPNNPKIAEDTTIQFTALALYSDGSIVNRTNDCTWESSDESKATIGTTTVITIDSSIDSIDGDNPGLATGVGVGTTTITATYGGNTDTTELTVIAATLDSIAIDQEAPAVAVGQTMQLSITGTLTDGSSVNLTSAAIWHSRDRSVARISRTGLVTGRAIGTANITAKYRGLGDSIIITVNQPPAIAARETINIRDTQVTLLGMLFNLGSASSVNVSFEWGETTAYGNETTPQTLTSTGGFGADISGLTPFTTYHFKVRAVGDGISWTKDQTFTTSRIPPSVSAYDASTITSSSATLHGYLSDKGTAENANVSFEWGLTRAFSNETTPQTLTSAGNFTAELSGLLPNTTYYFRAIAMGNGIGYSSVINSFTTLTVSPTVVTNDASAITRRVATLHGNLSDLGSASAVSVSFEWGLTQAYGNETTPQTATSTANFTAELKRLSPSITYHFRAKAVGDEISYGADKTFTTSKELVSIAITPPNPEITAGGTRQFTATSTYSDESTADITATVSWLSSNTGVASV